MNYKEIEHKQQILNQIKEQLKQEFYGIDQVIDQVVDTIQPWFLFNVAQTHPLIINLWGLTGTGKTTLVKRLVELLEKKQAFFRFEMNNQKDKDIDRQLTNALEMYEAEDYIICLDEFQYIRTLDDNGNEKDAEMSFNLWDFLDTGEFDASVTYRNFNNYLKWYNALKVWIDHGFKLSDGYIYYDEQPKQLMQYLRKFYKDFDSKFYEYVDRVERHHLFRLFPDRFENILDFETFYFDANEHELLQLIYEASRRKRKTEKGDMSKSLIFVLGNLDEAYHMSSDFNPDLNADAFYKRSLKIKVPQIKEALKKRFRNEQIARLGNNHIIYPALNKLAYEAIIGSHLKLLSVQFKSNYEIDLEFESRVNDMLYNNGVFPTQGVRPLKSSLKTAIDASLGQILSHLALAEIKADRIKMNYSAGFLNITYFHKNRRVGRLDIAVETSLDTIRQSVSENSKACTAVHEAGHAIISIALLDEIPTQLTAITANSESEGFASFDDLSEVLTKKDLLNYTARFLAGIEAERLVFGEDLISMGSRSDLKNATKLLLTAISENGFGSKLGFYAMKTVQNKNCLSEALPDIEQEVETLLVEAQKLTKKVLRDEKTLLLKIAHQLTKQNNLDASAIKLLVTTYSKTRSLTSIEETSIQHPHLDSLNHQLAQIPSPDLPVDERLIKNLDKFLKAN